MSEIKKLYSLSLTGEKEVVAKMEVVNRSFDAAKKNFQQLQAMQKTGSVVVNPKELEAEIKALIDAEKALINETKKKKEAQAESQALLGARIQERNEIQKQISANGALEGSYNDILSKIRLLKAEQKNNFNILGADDAELQRANTEIRELQDRINAFNRSLSSEGTNVGEYTRGIINAFKENGLDDLITNQIDKSKLKLNQLDQEFNDLVVELNMVRTAGVEDFSAVEKKIIDNRNEAQKLGKQLETVQGEFKGIGSIGEQVSTGLRNQFKSLKGEVAGYVLGYASFQAATGFLTELKDNAVTLESYNSALRAVSETEVEYAKNQEFLTRLSEQYGQNLLTLTQTYKGFYTASIQSGFTQDKTREIYESIIDSASVMKLKQDDLNGVLIAFSQILSKGKVQAEELRGQIGERLPGAFSIAAKAMGVTQQELNKMMEDGKVLSSEFLPKFAAELRKTFTNAGQEVKGLQAQINKYDNLKNTIANSEKFIKLVSTTISLLTLLASAIIAVPFPVWIALVTLLTAAYWSNIAALGAQTLALGRYVIVMGISNGVMAAARLIELAQVATLGLLNAAYSLLSLTVGALTLRIPLLRSAWAALNATFLSTPIGWIVAGLIAVGYATDVFASKVDDSVISMKKSSEQMKIRNEAYKQSIDIQNTVNRQIKETRDTVNDLVGVLRSEKSTLEEKEKALKRIKELNPEYLDGLNLSNILTKEGTAIIDRYIKSLDNLADAEARVALKRKIRNQQLDSQNKIDALKAEKQGAESGGLLYGSDGTLFGFEISRNKEKIQGDIDEESKNQKSLELQYKAIEQGNKKRIDELRKSISAGKAQLDKVKKDSEQAKKIAQDIANDQKALDILLGISNTSSGTPTGSGKASTLSGAQKDYLRDINADREAELSALKLRKLKGLETEETFLKKSLAINIKYNDMILDHFKGTDAITRKLRADTAADSIDKTIETNEKLFKIREDAYKQEFEDAKAAAQAQLDQINADPGSTQVDKVSGENTFYQSILAAQVRFNSQMDALENEFKLKSKKNAQDRKNAIIKEQSDLNRSMYQLSKAQFDALLQAAADFEEYRKNNIAIEASIQRMNVQRNKSLNLKQKEHEIDKINSAENLANINAELGKVNAQIKFYEDRREQQRLTNEELAKYNQLLKEKQLLEEKKAFGESDLKIKAAVELQLPSAEFVQNKIKSLFTDANGQLIVGQDANGNPIDGAPLLGEVIAQSFDLATLAMDNYFQAERDNVEKSRQLAYQRIELEASQSKFTAQSAAERETIDKEARAKKEKADRDASEKFKKIKRSEAAVAYATELANIAVAAAANPLNAFTFGGAGIAMYALLAGLATARYLMNISRINKEQFAQGGLPKKGGQFNGPSHDDGGIPVGMNEFEGDELAIINKRSARSNKVYTVTGTPKQIASAINEVGGGVSFASGAVFRKYASGGYFGSIVQPPIFRSYYERANESMPDDNNQSERLDRIEQMLEQTANTLNREVHRKTFISSRDLSKAQKDDHLQSEIGTL